MNDKSREVASIDGVEYVNEGGVRPKALNSELLRPTQGLGDLQDAIGEIRRSATAIMPREISQIENREVRHAIEESFLKVGQDVARLATALERVIEAIQSQQK